MQALLTDEALATQNEKRRKEHEAKRVTSEDGGASNTRFCPKEHKWKCPCSMLSGINCPKCKGENEDGECEVCNCLCDTGPVAKGKFQGISREAQREKNNIPENEPLQTANEKRDSFGRVMRTAVIVGQRDAMLNGLATEGDEGVNNILGGAAQNLASQNIDDAVVAQVAHDMGAPTSTFSDGTPVGLIQSNPQNHRFYANGLSKKPSRPPANFTARQQQQQQQRKQRQPPPVIQPPVVNSTVQQQQQQQPPVIQPPVVNSTAQPQSSLVQFRDDIILLAVEMASDGEQDMGRLIVHKVCADSVAQQVVETYHRQNKSVEEAIQGLKDLYITSS